MTVQHSRQDRLVRLADIDRLIADLQIEEARALRFEVVKADGKPMRIAYDFAIGRSGGIAWAIQQLRTLQGF